MLCWASTSSPTAPRAPTAATSGPLLPDLQQLRRAYPRYPRNRGGLFCLAAGDADHGTGLAAQWEDVRQQMVRLFVDPAVLGPGDCLAGEPRDLAKTTLALYESGIESEYDGLVNDAASLEYQLPRDGFMVDTVGSGLLAGQDREAAAGGQQGEGAGLVPDPGRGNSVNLYLALDFTNVMTDDKHTPNPNLEPAMNLAEFKERLLGGAAALLQNEAHLSALDSVLGDGDHGVTMAKIAQAMATAAKRPDGPGDLKGFLDDLAEQVMNVNGGTAGPLWATLIEGMAEPLPPGLEELAPDTLGRMFSGGLAALRQISAAAEGDKTLMDALIPAVAAANQLADDASARLAAAAAAARAGADRTIGYVARYGRAKYAKEHCLGHPDPGAVSLSLWLEGMEKVPTPL